MTWITNIPNEWIQYTKCAKTIYQMCEDNISNEWRHIYIIISKWIIITAYAMLLNFIIFLSNYNILVLLITIQSNCVIFIIKLLHCTNGCVILPIVYVLKTSVITKIYSVLIPIDAIWCKNFILILADFFQKIAR